MHQSPLLKQFPDIVHGFSDKSNGNMSLSFGASREVFENRRKFLSALGVGIADCVRIDDFHGTDVILVDDSFRGRGMADASGGPKADAAITGEKNLFLFLPTGDCLPIIFCDNANQIVALGHLSRINTPLKFAQKIVRKLKELGSREEDIFVVIGPGIHKESYVFSEEEIDSRMFDRDAWGNFLIRLPENRFAIDLFGCNRHFLLESGILEKNIEMSELDTCANGAFFSHYRSRKTGEKEGRMATVAGMRNRT